MWLPHGGAYEGLVDRREKPGARLSIRDPFGALASMIVMLMVFTFATQRHPAVIVVVAVAFASVALVRPCRPASWTSVAAQPPWPAPSTSRR